MEQDKIEDITSLLNVHALKPTTPTAANAGLAISPKRKRNISSTDNQVTKRSRMENSPIAQPSGDFKQSSGKLSKPSQKSMQKVTGARSTRVKGDVYDLPQDHSDKEASNAADEPKALAKRKVGRPKGTARPTAQGRKIAEKLAKDAEGIERSTPPSMHYGPQDKGSPEIEHDITSTMKLSSEKATVGNQADGKDRNDGEGAELNQQASAIGESEGYIEDGAILEPEAESIIRDSQGDPNVGKQRTERAEGDGLLSGDETNVLTQDEGQRQRVDERQKMLLGHDNLWQSITKSVHENRKVIADRKAILTGTIKELISAIKHAQRTYKEISVLAEDGERSEDLEGEISGYLDEIEDMVDDLSKPRKKQKTGAIVQDVYAHAAPQLIHLLKCAMPCRVLKSSKRAYDLAGFCEVVRIQQVTLLLCKKVIAWDIKPVTDDPIIRNIKQRMYPYLRDMAKNFKMKLKDEEIRERKRQNLRDFAPQPVQHETPSPERRRRYAARIVDQNSRIQAGINQEMARWRKQNGLLVDRPLQSLDNSQPDHLQRPAQTQDQSKQSSNDRQSSQATDRRWTEDEDKALVDQLLNNKETRRLPGKCRHVFIRCSITDVFKAEDRYTGILTTPLLQNLLPEHIRARALYHKPALIQATLEAFGRVPGFVHSIE